jgi:DHA2 family multidrug resistance protein
MMVIGVVLFGTMALVTPFMQHVIGYPILTAGCCLPPAAWARSWR